MESVRQFPDHLETLTNALSADNEFGDLVQILEQNREFVIVDNAEGWEGGLIVKPVSLIY